MNKKSLYVFLLLCQSINQSIDQSINQSSVYLSVCLTSPEVAGEYSPLQVHVIGLLQLLSALLNTQDAQSTGRRGLGKEGRGVRGGDGRMREGKKEGG